MPLCGRGIFRSLSLLSLLSRPTSLAYLTWSPALRPVIVRNLPLIQVSYTSSVAKSPKVYNKFEHLSKEEILEKIKMSEEQLGNKFSFAEEEEKILEYWNKIDAFQTSLKLSEGRPEYTFYDGPPFATGTPHYG